MVAVFRSHNWDLLIKLDTSMRGWRASCVGTTSTGGLWTKEERYSHININYLELLAAFLALKTFAPELKSSKILLHLDNITAISFINRIGGTHSPQLSNLAVKIILWKWCLIQTDAQIQTYYSWKPDPQALAVDALSISWQNHRPYLFPPFTLINRCHEKISQENI